MTDGRILGHEGIGVVEEVGSGVSGVGRGDRVLISCITSCGKCDFCKKGMYSHCRSGGWILGNTFDICQSILAPGGRLANVGVHGKPVALHIETLWDRNITLTTRLVDTVTTPMLLKVVQSGKLQPASLVTHRFALDDVMNASDTFGNTAQEGALKVILEGKRA